MQTCQPRYPIHMAIRTSGSHTGLMTNGQVVRVCSRRMGGAERQRSVFFVAEPDPAKAEELIREAEALGPHEDVEAVGPLPEEALIGLRLGPGEFTQG